MRVGVLIQARMSSQRLPGKALRPLAGRPSLARLLDRLSRVQETKLAIVATSSDKSDDPVATFCAEAGVRCFRGDLGDVAGRLLGAADTAGLDALVRVSGDSPLLDPRLVDRAIRLYVDGRGADLVTNVMPRSFPIGQSVEVIRTRVLRDAIGRFERPTHHEHVTEYFYEHAARFRIVNFSSPVDLSHVRLAVDTLEDVTRIEDLLRELGPDAVEAPLDDILAAVRSSIQP